MCGGEKQKKIKIKKINKKNKKEKERKNVNLTQVAGRRSSGGGATDVVVSHGECRSTLACPFGDLDLHRRWGGEQATLSLSLRCEANELLECS